MCQRHGHPALDPRHTPQPLTHRLHYEYDTTEANVPAGRSRKRSFVRSTGQHSNRFGKRATEPNPVPAEPDKAEEPDQQQDDSFTFYNHDGEWTETEEAPHEA